MMLDLYQVQTDQLYLKSSFEMESLFDKKYIENTNDIIRLCNVTIPKRSNVSLNTQFQRWRCW